MSALLPLRSLGASGVLTDIDPYDLPLGSWSFGINIRFTNGRVERGPVFFDIADLPNDISPTRYICSTYSSSGIDDFFIGLRNGRVYEWNGTDWTNRSDGAWVDADADACYTSTSLADVFYINRSDRVPWSKLPADTDFDLLAIWDANWRTEILRSYSGCLVAFNVTKSGVAFPTMVKTSDVADAGLEPASWDHADPSTLAVENILSEMSSAIIDAQTLKDVMIIYGYGETWLMQADGSDNVYSYRRIFNDAGAINANCSVEVGGNHYVFGPTDLWVHDGLSKQSIVGGKNRDFVFGGLNLQYAHRCFVFHNLPQKEVYFCYVSQDRAIQFEGEGCNRAAVYNYENQTWTFYDLPLVFGATYAAFATGLTYDAATETYEDIGGTYADQSDGLKKVLMTVSDPIAGRVDGRLHGYELVDQSSLAVAKDPDANTPALLERDGIDLDEINAELRGYKHVLSLYPQIRGDTDAELFQFRFGSSDFYGSEADYTAYQTFDPFTEYKIDYKNSGRYLSMHMLHEDTTAFRFSGLDVEVNVTGPR